MAYECMLYAECHLRGTDSSATATRDDIDDDDDDPSRIRLMLQTKDSRAKKCRFVIGKVSAALLLLVY